MVLLHLPLLRLLQLEASDIGWNLMFWKGVTLVNCKAWRLRQWNLAALSGINISKVYFQEFAFSLNSFHLIKYWYFLQCQWLLRIFFISYSSFPSIIIESDKSSEYLPDIESSGVMVSLMTWNTGCNHQSAGRSFKWYNMGPTHFSTTYSPKQ